uniref:Uncharacterized protein n=1 Tax=Cacopsylla melanoneura TaxID=428564 RepID=A0A8D8LRT1_9HEMI
MAKQLLGFGEKKSIFTHDRSSKCMIVWPLKKFSKFKLRSVLKANLHNYVPTLNTILCFNANQCDNKFEGMIHLRIPFRFRDITVDHKFTDTLYKVYRYRFSF